MTVTPYIICREGIILLVIGTNSKDISSKYDKNQVFSYLRRQKSATVSMTSPMTTPRAMPSPTTMKIPANTL